MLNTLFNILFKITPHNTERRKKKTKKRKNKVGAFTTIFAVGHLIQLLPSSCLTQRLAGGVTNKPSWVVHHVSRPRNVDLSMRLKQPTWTLCIPNLIV